MHGAMIERGVIQSALSGNTYTVESLGRAGIVTPPLPTLGGNAYTAGDVVYYFLFEDGHGLILATTD